jgi:hypothetical protein
MGLCSSSSRGPRRFSRRPRRVRIDSSPGDILHEEMNAGNDESVAELHTYIRNNQDVIPNGTRFWQGERISTGFVESMVTIVARADQKRAAESTRLALPTTHLLWEDIYLLLKNLSNEDPLLCEFLELMESHGLNPGRPIASETMRAFLSSSDF